MENFVLSCCSTVDLTKEYLQSRNIYYVFFHYELDGQQYFDDFGESVPFPIFYQAVAKGAMTRTSQVNVQEYTEHFRKILEQGQDILHVALSSGMSGTVNSANIAATHLREEYPERKIIIVDSLGASAGQGMLVDALADLRDSGMSLEEVSRWAEENRLRLNHWVLSTDLTCYIRGGRISKASGIIGSVLGICPLIYVDKGGHLTVVSKIRSKKKGFRELVNRMKEHADHGIEYAGKCFISHANCLEDAQTVAHFIENEFLHLDGKVRISDIGTAIGSHTGPGTIALYFWGDRRH